MLKYKCSKLLNKFIKISNKLLLRSYFKEILEKRYLDLDKKR